MRDLGTVRPGSTLYIPFNTFDSNDPSASVTISGLATTDIEIYKNGGTTQRASDSGYTLLDTDGIDFDGVTGVHGISVDLADNATAGFYAAGAQYWIVVSSITVDAATVNFVAATFTIGYPDALLNTTVATLSTQTSFTLSEGSTTNGAYVGCPVIQHDVASAVEIEIGVCNGYTGSTKTMSLATDIGIFTLAATDNISIMMPANTRWAGTTLWASGSITAGTIAADAIGASELAADAATEIAAAVWDKTQSSHTTGGSFGELATEIANILADTNELQTDDVPGLIAALDAVVDTVKAETALILTDTGTTLETHLTDIKGATFSGATDSLEAVRDRGDAAWVTGAGGTPPQLLQSTTITGLSSQTLFNLTAGSADDDAYNGAVVVVTDQSTSTQKAVGSVSDYTGSTKTITLSSDPGIFTMANGDTIDIIANASTAPSAADVRAEIDNNSTQLAAIVADTNELQTDDVPGLIAALDAVVDTVKAETALIVADTNELQTDDVPGLIAALDAVVDTVKAETALIVADTNELQTDDVPGLIAALDTVVDTVKAETALIVADTNELQTDDVPGLIAALDAVVDGVKAITDQMVFTKASELDVNVQSINGAGVTGDGNATPWDGA